MPQMAPMNWICLYIFFSMIFMLILMFNYFNFMYPPKSFKTMAIKNFYNWKW
uniref:ATP synthase F0 subunit 8 n=1 Tax=Pissodes yunnanensis TaxID=1723750 RepID=UPI00207A489C|nr:ATP synthase F0 subunit 8 [Pissodes yunnanensis]URP30499.1 ATP synthase F0 subunit 8 [Pissodes yunnanensis]